MKRADRPSSTPESRVMNIHRLRRRDILAVLLVLVGLGPALPGCQATANKDKASPQGLAEAPEETPSMSPAQRDRAYRAAYQEGLRLVQKAHYGLAIQRFEQAVELKPLSAEALFNLGACHEAIGDPLRAINIYKRVLELDPEDSDCYANLGTAFIKMYYREKSPIWRKMARDAWQRSLAMNPNQPDVRAFMVRSESLD